jgi:hypothetical protein
MSTSAILPIPAVVLSAAPSPAVVNTLNAQHQQGIHNENVAADQAPDQVPPDTADALSAIDAADTGLNSADIISIDADDAYQASTDTGLDDGSDIAPQTPLAFYQQAGALASSSPTIATANTDVAAATGTDGLVQGAVPGRALPAAETSLSSTQPASRGDYSLTGSSNSQGNSNDLIAILNRAFGPRDASPAAALNNPSPDAGLATAAISTDASPSSSPAVPCDTLVAAIQANLAAGGGTITPAQANLHFSGNFVNTPV